MSSSTRTVAIDKMGKTFASHPNYESYRDSCIVKKSISDDESIELPPPKLLTTSSKFRALLEAINNPPSPSLGGSSQSSESEMPSIASSSVSVGNGSRNKRVRLNYYSNDSDDPEIISAEVLSQMSQMPAVVLNKRGGAGGDSSTTNGDTKHFYGASETVVTNGTVGGESLSQETESSILSDQSEDEAQIIRSPLNVVEFHVEVASPRSTSKSAPYAYVNSTRFLFSSMGVTVPFRISVLMSDFVDMGKCVIRAWLEFGDLGLRYMRVERCPAHLSADEAAGERRLHDVLRSKLPGSLVSYETNERAPHARCVIISLANIINMSLAESHHNDGSIAAVLPYSFHCLSSCQGGIQRRQLTMFFQLEKDNQVLGVSSFSLKLVACPGRDAKHYSEVCGRSITGDSGVATAHSATRPSPSPSPSLSSASDTGGATVFVVKNAAYAEQISRFIRSKLKPPPGVILECPATKDLSSSK